MDDDGRPGEIPSQVANRPGVVEVDVGEDDPGQVVGPQADGGEGLADGGGAGLGSGLDEGGAVADDEEPGGHSLPSPQEGVDLEDAGGDGLDGGHGRESTRLPQGPGVVDGVDGGDPAEAGEGETGTRVTSGPSRERSWLRSAFTRASSWPYAV
jgi:hypothetical protein